MDEWALVWAPRRAREAPSPPCWSQLHPGGGSGVVGRQEPSILLPGLSEHWSASPWDFPGGLVVSLWCEFSPWSEN